MCPVFLLRPYHLLIIFFQIFFYRTCADTVQGLCYAMFRQGQCVNPSGNMVSKSTCCCAALPFSVPKGWGVPCQQCAMPGSYEFEQLCPYGNGFTNSGEDINEVAR